MDKNISVLMSVYAKDKPKYILEALESILNQSLPAKQIVIVVDGPVGEEITETLNNLKDRNSIIEIYPLENNVGLGNALKYGSEKCQYDYIARMDSDDIAIHDRFEKQMKCFEDDNELGVVGSNGQEFFENLDNMANIKAVPETHEEIVDFMKSRCPFCHMSVMMKKQALIDAGGYQDWYYAEDWYLWIRMYLAGVKFYNIQENLMFIRINYDTFERRSGIKLYKSIKNLLKYLKQHKIIGWAQYMKEKFRRFLGYVVVPKKMKRRLYMRFMRKKKVD